MTQYYEVTTSLGGGEYMFRGFTSDPNYQYPGCKTFLDPISEERMRDTQKYNPGYETLLIMTTPKFTPGPWGLGDSSYGGQSAIIAEDDSIVGYASRVESNWRENATLIASAPRMFDYINRKAVEGCSEAQSIIDSLL